MRVHHYTTIGRKRSSTLFSVQCVLCIHCACYIHTVVYSTDVYSVYLLCTLNSVQYTLYTRHTVQCSVQYCSMQYFVWCILYSVYSVYCIQCTVYTLHCICYTQCAVYTQCTLHCTVYNAVYSVYCAQYTLHTLFSVQYVLYCILYCIVYTV